MKKIVLGIFLLLTLTTSSVFASMVENSRQGFPAISAEMHPEPVTREPGTLLGFELRFLGFCIRSGISYTDPFGLSCYKSLIVNVIHVDNVANRLIPYRKDVIETAFSFINPVSMAGANFMVIDTSTSKSWVNDGPFGFLNANMYTQEWTPETKTIFSLYSKADTSDILYANIILSETNFRDDAYPVYGYTLSRESVVDWNNGLHFHNLINVAKTMAHETGQQLDLEAVLSAGTIMSFSDWSATNFFPAEEEIIKSKLQK